MLCYVVCDDRKSSGFYIVEFFCFIFDKDGEFVFVLILDDDSLNYLKIIKDLFIE